MIKAVSFDLWDTVIHDDSDEPKRLAQGLRTKSQERRYLVWEALDRVEAIDYETVRLAYDVAEAAFRHVWHDQHVTWTVAERIDVILKGLARELPDKLRDEVIRAHEEMEIVVTPDPVEGIGDALAELAKRYKLCVVSDAIVSPGRCLRTWLDLHGFKGYFSGFAFSDEVGYSKPHHDMFAAVSEQLEVDLKYMVHVGDRDHNDVKGPQALGMKAILFTGTRDKDKHNTSADAICEHHRDLPGIVDRLAQQS